MYMKKCTSNSQRYSDLKLHVILIIPIILIIRFDLKIWMTLFNKNQKWSPTIILNNLYKILKLGNVIFNGKVLECLCLRSLFYFHPHKYFYFQYHKMLFPSKQLFFFVSPFLFYHFEEANEISINVDVIQKQL